jgi:hypothetical protein
MWKTESGPGVLLAAGNATLELVDETQANAIVQIEVGQRLSGPFGLPFRSPTARRQQNAWPVRPGA